MTLEEIHEQLENIQREITDELMFTDEEIEFNGELIKIVEELKVYKKAYSKACEQYCELSGADIDLFMRDVLEDASIEVKNNGQK